MMKHALLLTKMLSYLSCFYNIKHQSFLNLQQSATAVSIEYEMQTNPPRLKTSLSSTDGTAFIRMNKNKASVTALFRTLRSHCRPNKNLNVSISFQNWRSL